MGRRFILLVVLSLGGAAADADSLTLDLDRAGRHSPPAATPYVQVDLSGQPAGNVTAQASAPGLSECRDEYVKELVLNLKAPAAGSGSRVVVSGPGVVSYQLSRPTFGAQIRDVRELEVFFRPDSLAAGHSQTFTITGQGGYHLLNALSFDVSVPDRGDRLFAAALITTDCKPRNHRWVWADTDGRSVGTAAPFPTPLRTGGVLLAGFAGYRFFRLYAPAARRRVEDHSS